MKAAMLPNPKDMPRRFEDLVRMVPPHAIHDEADYEHTRALIDRLVMIPRPSKGQAQYLDTLTVLLEAYEREHHAIDTSDITPLDLLNSLLAEHGMSGTDLARLLGCSKATVSLILSGQRDLTKNHIRVLCERFSLSADAFLG